MAPKVSEEHMQARSKQILDAAAVCFAEKGFHQCSMHDICAKAALSPGAVYRYFSSKEQIIEMMSEVGRQQNQELFEQALAIANVGELFARLIDLFFDMYTGERGRLCLKLDVMLEAEAINNEGLRKILSHNFRQVYHQLRLLVDKAKQQLWIDKRLDTEAVVQAMVALHQGLKAQLIIDPGLDVQAYKNAVLAMFSGLRKLE